MSSLENWRSISLDKPGLHSCLQIFPTTDIIKTALFYRSLGFRDVYYLESSEPHACLYRDAIEIILIQSNNNVVSPNRELHGYGYDAYFIANQATQIELEKEFSELGATIVRSLSMTNCNNSKFVFEDIDGRWIAVGRKAY